MTRKGNRFIFMRQYTGISIGGGIAIAPALRLRGQEEHLTTEWPVSLEPSPHSLDQEYQRFEQACVLVAEQLQSTQARIARQVGQTEADIFLGQQALLEDPGFRQTFRQHLQQKLSAEVALQETLTAYEAQFRAMHQPLFRQRIYDLQDVWSHVLAYLVTGAGIPPVELTSPVILVGQELLPSQLAHLEWKLIRGIVTSQGGPSSHTAILARAMQIPYMYNVHQQHEIADHQIIILDGNEGLLYVNPRPDIEALYRQETKKQLSFSQPSLPGDTGLPSHRTRCGQPVTLRANASVLADIAATTAACAEGIGLFRTEILYASRPQFPTEDEQIQLYRSVLQQLKPFPVTFRTFDVGGDKQMTSFPTSPFSLSPLGWRGIRIQLDRWDLLQPQLRALLRSSPAGCLRVMFPMISTYDELQRLLALIDKEKNHLLAHSHEVAKSIAWGVMIETPSAALQIEHFAPILDFVSIGTNDLLQFLMAAERNNPRVNHLLQPTQPALLRLIQMVVQVGKQYGCQVSLCGDMAAHPMYIPLLLGLGLREFSIPPKQLAPIQQCLHQILLSDAETLAHDALYVPSSSSVFEMVQRFAYESGIAHHQPLQV